MPPLPSHAGARLPARARRSAGAARRRWRRRLRSAVGLVALAALALPLAAWSKAVVVVVDGEEHTLRTYAATVADVLDQLEVGVGPHDAVLPRSTTEVQDGLEIEVARAISVEIVLDGAVETVTAPVSSVAGALEAAGVGVVRRLDADIVPRWTAPVEDGDTIVVNLPAAVTVAVDGQVHRYETLVSNVENLLVRKGIDLDEHDRVSPALWTPIESGTAVVIERVDHDEVVEEVVLEHDEQRLDTDDLDRGTTRVRHEGADGLRLDTYRVTYVDGDEVARELVDQEVVAEPQDRVILVGTYDPPPPPPPPPSPESSEASTSSDDDAVWDRLARCESGGRWDLRGYYHGGLQFHPDTWRRHRPSGHPDYAYEASREQQIEVGKRVQRSQGWGAWPHCSSALGLR